ncbi:MAG: Hint domain-containing protein [Sulfitobacter sp.]
MPTFDVKFYDGSPGTDNGFVDTPGNFFNYTGPATPTGTASITDNEAGIGGQVLQDEGDEETTTADVSIGGLTSTGRGVFARESWLIRDTVTGDEFTVVEFEVNGGDANGRYTLSEMPLVAGRSYEVLEFSPAPVEADGDPVFTYSEYVCFAPGTMIATPTGARPVEALRTGDLVMTLDRGPQPLIWTGARTLTFGPEPHKQKPILIQRDSLGPECPATDLIVSPQHRILFATDAGQALGPAKGLLGRKGIRQMNGKRLVRYHKLMAPRHEVLTANGLHVESFYPGRYGLTLLSWVERLQIITLIPGLLNDIDASYGARARRCLNAGDVRKLAGAHEVLARPARSLTLAA